MVAVRIISGTLVVVTLGKPERSIDDACVREAAAYYFTTAMRNRRHGGAAERAATNSTSVTRSFSLSCESFSSRGTTSPCRKPQRAPSRQRPCWFARARERRSAASVWWFDHTLSAVQKTRRDDRPAAPHTTNDERGAMLVRPRRTQRQRTTREAHAPS